MPTIITNGLGGGQLVILGFGFDRTLFEARLRAVATMLVDLAEGAIEPVMLAGVLLGSRVVYGILPLDEEATALVGEELCEREIVGRLKS